MFCPNCGKEMNDGAKLCNNCGWSRKVKISINKKMIILLSGIFVSIIIIILSLSLKNSSIQNKTFYQQLDEATTLIDKIDTIDYDKIKTVFFGNYNGVPIEWIVITKQKSKNKMSVCLFSKYVLDKVAIDPSKSYGSEKVNLYTSYLYKWLNNTFYYNAFTEEERNKIEEAGHCADKVDSYGRHYSIYYGDENGDYVRLACIEDYNTIFKKQPKIAISHDIKTNKPIEWWIANTQNYSYVDENGVIQACEKIEDNPLGIRPAIEIEILESD